jgi:signal transduction histidine kinase
LPSEPVSWTARIAPREVPFSWARFGHLPLALAGLAWFDPAQWPFYLALALVLAVIWPFCIVLADGVEVYFAVAWTSAAGAYLVGPMILPIYWVGGFLGFALIVLLDSRGSLPAIGLAAQSARRARGEAYEVSSVADGDIHHTRALVEHALRVLLAAAGRALAIPLIPVAVVGEALVAIVVQLAPIPRRVAPRHAFERIASALGHAMPLATTVLHTTIVCFLLLSERAGGPAGFVVASLSTLTLHFVLRRLSDTRIESERQRAVLLAMQDELARRERLATIGQTASSVFHQIARHHGAVGMYAHLITHADHGLPSTVREHAARITASVEEANHVIDELLRFGQDRTLHVYPCSLGELVGECVAAVTAGATERGVRLAVTRLDDVVVAVDKRKLAQVIDNLLDNAIEASPAGATVEVALTHDGDAARVAVRDAGPGVAEQVRGKLFTPFCTTKPDGIGLGLALARELAEAHGGAVRYEPTERGALFVIDVPVAGPSAP